LLSRTVVVGWENDTGSTHGVRQNHGAVDRYANRPDRVRNLSLGLLLALPFAATFAWFSDAFALRASPRTV